MSTSMLGNEITPEVIKEAEAACDRALAHLFELFADAPRQPQYIEYDLVMDADGGYRCVIDDVDLLIRKAIASTGKDR